MNTAVRKAKEIYDKYSSDPDKVASGLGLEVLEVPMEGSAKEFYWGDCVTLKEGLTEPERRELLAHAVCHHLLHAGSHYARSEGGYSYGNYHEKQANVFAAFLLVPDEELEKLTDKDLTIYDLAEKFKITPWFAKFRIGLAKHYNPKKFNFLWSHS
jgi:Zn-dependent peptidase ImmA (M78 family)